MFYSLRGAFIYLSTLFPPLRAIKSQSDKYPVGSLLYITRGWQTISKITEADVWNRVDNIKPTIDAKHYMGLVGMPG